MPSYSPIVRKDGGRCWDISGGDPQKAVQLFKEWHPEAAASMPRPEKNLKRWNQEWADRTSYERKKGGGRPFKITSTAELAQCCTALKRGRRIGGVYRHYTSIKEAAAHEKVIRTTAKKYEVTLQHLLRAMHRHDPSLARGKEKLRRYLDNEHRAKRRSIARTLLRMPLSYLKRVFFLDAKHLYIVPPVGYVWCDAAELGSLFVEDPAARTKPWCLNYYAMVNWFGGAVDLIWVSGTTNQKCTFKVSQPNCTLVVHL
jgi:ribosomal protein L13E